MKCLYVLVALSVVVAVSAQNSGCSTGILPSQSEIDQILRDKVLLDRLVKCLTNPEFDRQNCDCRLEKAHREAPDFFSPGARSCATCTKEELNAVNSFLRKFEKVNSRNYRKFIDQMFERVRQEAEIGF